MAYTWKGRDGRLCVVTEVDNRHLLNTLRLARERDVSLHEQMRDPARARDLRWLEKIHDENVEAIGHLWREAANRGLDELPIRTPEEKAQQQQQWEQQRQQRAAEHQANYNALVGERIAQQKLAKQLKLLRAKQKAMQEEIELLEIQERNSEQMTERRILLVNKPDTDGEDT